MKSKEEILGGRDEWVVNGVPFNVSTTDALEAMEEYAREVAIDFASWCAVNYYLDGDGFYHHDYKNKIHYPIEQLFELYKKERGI